MKISRIKWFAPKSNCYIPEFWPPHPPCPLGYPPRTDDPTDQTDQAYDAASADLYGFQYERNEMNNHSLPNMDHQNYFSDFDARCHSEPQNPETFGAGLNNFLANIGNINNDGATIPYFSDPNSNEMVSCQPSSRKIKRTQSQESLFHFSQLFEDDFADCDEATLAQNVSLLNIPSNSYSEKRKRGRKGYSTVEEKEAAKRESCKRYAEKRRAAFQELKKSVTILEEEHQNLLQKLQQTNSQHNYYVQKRTFTPIPPLSKLPYESKRGGVKRCRENRVIRFRNFENRKKYLENENENLQKIIKETVPTANSVL